MLEGLTAAPTAYKPVGGAAALYMSRPRSNSGHPGYFMSKMSSSNHYIRLDESFPTMYRSRGCRQGPDTSRRLLQLYYCAETAVWQPVLVRRFKY
jgi:hypothetical protein